MNVSVSRAPDIFLRTDKLKLSDSKRLPFECIALLLQGGGALGAYQAGVYQCLDESEINPDWVAGISIGAINAAIISGNAPAARVDMLRRFWNKVSAEPFSAAARSFAPAAIGSECGRRGFNQLSAAATLVAGVDGFFIPRILPPVFQLEGSAGATSYYDTRPLRVLLEQYVDFDRINGGPTRFSAGAVNVRTGNFVYFDSTTHNIKPEHIMASAALPPGFPAIEIEGEQYWDGGLVSNTPLQWVLQCGPRQDTLAFQVDLWSAVGTRPRSMMEVATRQKEILYSSRTRDNTAGFAATQQIRHSVAGLIERLPPELRDCPEALALKEFRDRKRYNIVHLIYRTRAYEGDSKDYDFSRLSMKDHWTAGYNDTLRTLRHPEVLEPPKNTDGVAIFDFLAREPNRKHREKARQ